MLLDGTRFDAVSVSDLLDAMKLDLCRQLAAVVLYPMERNHNSGRMSPSL